MNNDLISRKALREDLRRFFPTDVLEGIEPKTLFAQILHDIDNAPTVEQRPHGKWIGKEEYDDYPYKTVCECSECGKMITVSHNDFPNFCPNCGADMRGEDHD